MSGILVTYQDILCESVRFRRRRGYAADLSEVTMPVHAFPSLVSGFRWELPGPGQIQARKKESPAGVDSISDTAIEAGELPRELKSEGPLVIAGRRPDNSTYEVIIQNLFVLKVETEQLDDVSEIAWVKLTLVDERYFWSRGVLDRWSFTRPRADGSIARDSLGKDGNPLSRAQVFERHIAVGLFRSPSVSNTPERWDTTTTTQFEPFGSALRAMTIFIDETGVEDPCFRLDGTIAIHDRGEGRIGFAENGEGANIQDIPREFFLSEDGRGQGVLMEASYPEDFVIVVGEPRVATVAVDDWEPVVVQDGEPFFLSERLVRRLTDDKFGLEWLSAWLLQPTAVQNLVDIPQEVAILFREQAYRLFRLPKAEKIEEGAYAGPGRNADLLPLRDRAGTVGGRRKGVTIEASRFETRHKTAAFTEADRALIQAFAELSKVRRLIQQLRNQAQSGGEAQFRFDVLGDPILGREGAGGLLGAGGLPAEVRAALRLSGAAISALPASHRGSASTAIAARANIEQVREDLGDESANQLDAALRGIAEARGGAALILFDLAKETAALIKAAGIDDLGDLEDLAPNERALLENNLKAAAEAAGRQLDEVDRDRETRERAGVAPGAAEGVVLDYFQVNLPRQTDSGGRVFDRDLGIVRTSGLAGNVVDVAVPTPADTTFRPCPVRALFGATTRPRIDALPGTGGRLATGPPPAPPAPGALCVGGQTIITKFLTDRETIYLALFKRVGRGQAVKVELKDVPLDQATRVKRNWQELIPLVRNQEGLQVVGEGNKAVLDKDAEEIAQQIFSRRPLVKIDKRRLADAWPIQCDGIVAGIEITTERDPAGIPAGFTTTVIVGSNNLGGAQTTTRPRRGQPDEDAAQREAFPR